MLPSLSDLPVRQHEGGARGQLPHRPLFLMVSQASPIRSWVLIGLEPRLPSWGLPTSPVGNHWGLPALHCRTDVTPCLTTLALWEHTKRGDGQEVFSERQQDACWPLRAPAGGAAWPLGASSPAAGAQGAPLLAAIRVSCTGSCRVSNKANDTAWVAEEGYFNSVLLLADKGEYVWEPACSVGQAALLSPILCPGPGPVLLVTQAGRPSSQMHCELAACGACFCLGPMVSP